MSERIKKILLVADYGKNDLAFKEVQQRLYEQAAAKHQRIHIDIVSVDPFNTAQTAAVVAQAAEDGKYDVIYHNTAPRKDSAKERPGNDGEGLYYTKYKNAKQKTVDIIGVSSGNTESVNTFALLKNKDSEVFKIKSDINQADSQFRSRDVFVEHVVHVLTGTLELDDKPFIPPTPSTQNFKVAEAKLHAEKLLEEAYQTQYSRHGDAGAAYVTVITAPINHRDNLKAQLKDTAKHIDRSAEVDALPIKSKGNNWIDSGFLAAQLALNSTQPESRTIIALPYAGETLDTAKDLYVAKLDNGATVITRDVETLFFVKDRLGAEGVKRYGQEGRSVHSSKDGSIAVSGRAELSLPSDTPGKPVSIASALKEVKLPYPITPIWTDGYGNIKLSIAYPELLRQFEIDEKTTERVALNVEAGGTRKEALVRSGSFKVKDGDWALSKGSSGWTRGNQEKEPVVNFTEIFLRGGHASPELGNPNIGSKIEISGKKIEKQLPGSIATDRQVEPSVVASRFHNY